ncbi:DEAD/DEAH box helicase [Mycoplasmopsis opalescens]|uniref:DEAD/DEAH box helicase n=1 Tax=Mycoplasmopsis opalescens TaxID=114886 RepID=UPI00068DBF49|nr:DEAD/DEAH box helicase [Mycoplasmopsis opalescens]
MKQDLKENNHNNYETLLQNLLDVSPNDPSIFAKINNKFSFDFFKVFGQKAFDIIYRQKNFNIPILEQNLVVASDEITSGDTAEKVLQILDENGIEISENKLNRLNKNFNDAKESIIEEIKLLYQRQSLRWKLFLNRAKEISDETNSWPMHLGFAFVKVSIDGKAVYGPLFLKEVYMKIVNGVPHLSSDGEIVPNEKLLFLLGNANFDLKIGENIGNFSIRDMVEYINEKWDDLYHPNLKLDQPFVKQYTDTVINTTLEFCPGLILGLFQPVGGYVRNRMLEIINNDQLNKILKVEFNKNTYKQKVSDALFDPKTSIFKITPTNYSQDRAIASSLNQNTIIWGPPGTGKSQTIVNILTNLLVYQKTSLVCSQKKAALEVLRKRLEDLNIFCFFVLNNKGMNKHNFYKPIQDYLDYLENFEGEAKLSPLRAISKQDVAFVTNIGSFANKKNFNTYAKLLHHLSGSWYLLNQEIFEAFLQLDASYVYPENLNFSSVKEMIKSVRKVNKCSYSFWDRKYYRIAKLVKITYPFLKQLNLNLNKVLPLIKDLNVEDFNELKGLMTILPEDNNERISDIKQIKRFVAKNIIKRLSALTQEEKELYQEFSTVVRIGNLEPYKLIKRYAQIIKKVFPVIITTPDTDLSAWEKEEFDYAILDESSQIFIEKGLPVLYLAKIKILAGDNQQMKPSNWFGVRVTDDETIYGNVDSLLDFAKSVGVYNVLLDKNYRSNYASLMTFSSKYFYNSNLDVIDSAEKPYGYYPVEVIEVNGVWEGSKNEAEIDEVIRLTLANKDKYKKIIILCFNAKQQEAITTRIFAEYPDLEARIENKQIMLRNIENIQGDEADLVIASVAYDASTSFHATYVGRGGGMNALNVAISRAKDKMIVVKSFKASSINNPNDNPDVKIFKKWIEFLEYSEEEKQNLLDIDFNQNATEKAILEDFEDHKTMTIPVASELKQEIMQSLQQWIENKDRFYLAENESIGTLKVDFIVKCAHVPVLAILVDDYSYVGNAEKFIQLNDLCRFIQSKKYRLFKLDRIAWEAKKDEIIEIINEFHLNDLATKIVDTAQINEDLNNKTIEF